MGSWIFQGNPDYHDTVGAVHALSETTWLVRQYKDAIEEGDSVYLWETGPTAGIVARAIIIEGPTEREALPEETQFYRQPERFAGHQLRALLRLTKVIDPLISRDTCLADPTLSTLPNLRFANATNFRLDDAQ